MYTPATVEVVVAVDLGTQRIIELTVFGDLPVVTMGQVGGQEPGAVFVLGTQQREVAFVAFFDAMAGRHVGVAVLIVGCPQGNVLRRGVDHRAPHAVVQRGVDAVAQVVVRALGLPLQRIAEAFAQAVAIHQRIFGPRRATGHTVVGKAVGTERSTAEAPAHVGPPGHVEHGAPLLAEGQAAQAAVADSGVTQAPGNVVAFVRVCTQVHVVAPFAFTEQTPVFSEFGPALEAEARRAAVPLVGGIAVDGFEAQFHFQVVLLVLIEREGVACAGQGAAQAQGKADGVLQSHYYCFPDVGGA
ncbi:hypothetical protein D3C76_1083680 [compost metagenome]